MKNALSLKMLFTSLIIASTLLVALVLVALWRASLAETRLIKVNYARYNSYLLADELRQSSDDLTRMARTYVVTGDARFEQQYNDVLAIRNGKKPRPLNYERIYWDLVVAAADKPRADGAAIPLQTLMQGANFTDAEFAKLKEAQHNSDALVKTEVIAMNAVKGLFDNGNGQFTLHGKPDLEMARRIMHDADYHQFKARIMQPVDEFFVLLDKRTQGAVEEAEHSSRQAYIIVVSVVVFALLAAVAALLFVYRLIDRQLGGEPAYARAVVEQIAAGNLAGNIMLDDKDHNSLLFAMRNMQNNLTHIISNISHNAGTLLQSAERLAETAGLVAEQTANQQGANLSMTAAVEQMSSSVAEITTTMEELSASSTQIADHSQSVVNVANHTLESSKKGSDAMQQLLGRMGDIRADNQKSLQEIVHLSTKSKQIAKVMDLINAVADQTKLIAFNAALEASSAGDSGKRFSVVAAEIRRLADSVTDSTREIEDKIQEIQDAISRLVITSEKGAATITSGMDVSANTAEILGALVKAASQNSNAAQQISLSTQQQKTACSQVVLALREIATASSYNAHSVKNIADVSCELVDMSTTLNELMQQFKLI